MEDSLKQSIVTVDLNVCELCLLFKAVDELEGMTHLFTYGNNDNKELPVISKEHMLNRLKTLGNESLTLYLKAENVESEEKQ